MVAGKKKKRENWGKGLRTRWKSCGRRKYKWGEQQGEVVCSAGLLWVGSSRRRGWRCGGEAGSPASAPHSLHGSPPAPSSSLWAQRCQVRRSRVLERPKQAVILLAPMERGPRAAPRWPHPFPPSLLLQAQRRWVLPSVLVQSSVGKKNSPCCFGVMFTSSVGFSAVNTRGQQASCCQGWCNV